MKEKTNFQERFLLSLSNKKEDKVIRKILKSPLGLAKEIIRLLFNNKFKEVRDNLDSIKQFVAGITRAESLNKYKIASFYSYLFSFQQFFHSSYRARQGKTLEEFIKEIIRKAGTGFEVPDKLKDKKELMSEVFIDYNSNLDLDVIAKKSNGKVLVVQLLSRDDTGGTTAKSSLVEALREAIDLKVKEDSELHYLVAIWDKIHSNQKNITLKKIYSSLKPYLDKEITEDYFLKNIESGIKVRENITLELSYGTDEISTSISDWLGSSESVNSTSIKKLINSLEKWDDLWLSYAMVSLELENIELKGKNNIVYLNKLLKGIKYDLSSFTKSEEYVKLANNLAIQLIPKWVEDSLPVSSLSEKAHYIRDLILLKFMYEVS